MVKLLMGCKSLDLKKKNDAGHTALHLAAIHGRLPIMEYLLHKSLDRLQHQNFDQDSENAACNQQMLPIHYAVLKNNKPMVEYLIGQKADEIYFGAFRSKISDCNTEPEKEKVIKQHREKKAKYFKNNDEKIAQIQKELVNKPQQDLFTSVLYACHRGNLPILELLEEYGGDVELTSRNRVSCLHLACASGNLDLVKHLILVRGMDPQIKSHVSGS